MARNIRFILFVFDFFCHCFSCKNRNNFFVALSFGLWFCRKYSLYLCIMVDVVITYVDGKDPLWQKDYALAIGREPLTKRFRSWDTLKYLFRGIEFNMPFVDNVYLVVSRQSQVPSWVSDNVKIVLHEDIIPAEFLPTFNSATIGLFLPMIKGLKERYLYFNDDIFPLLPCSEELFFDEGKIATGFANCLIVKGFYKRHVRNSDRLARKTLGLGSSLIYKRPQHCCIPLLKSTCLEVWDKVQIFESISQTRETKNLNQSLFLNYLYYSGKAINRRLPSKFLSLALNSPDKVASSIANPSKEFACINDVELSPKDFDEYKSKMIAAFEQRFPEVSRFENN